MQNASSGMRPTGRLHLGHYHGVLKNWVKLQAEYPLPVFVADWHALTTAYDDPRVIEESVWDMLVDWLAAGWTRRRQRCSFSPGCLSMLNCTCCCR